VISLSWGGLIISSIYRWYRFCSGLGGHAHSGAGFVLIVVMAFIVAHRLLRRVRDSFSNLRRTED
jgi:hypothetical protein